MPFLPRNQVRQHFPRCLAVADEVVVDEIQARRRRFLRQNKIQLANQLLRRLHARLPAIKVRDIAELAQIGTTGGELQSAQQVFVQLDQIVGGIREIAQRKPLLTRVFDLCRRRGHGRIDSRNEIVRSRAQFADVQIVEIRILFGRRRNGRSTQGCNLAVTLRPPAYVVNFGGLNVHAGDEYGVGPLEVGRPGGLHVFCEESDPPGGWKVVCNQQYALRRHERLRSHQAKGVRKSAEGGRVRRKDAQNISFIKRLQGAAHRDNTCTSAAASGNSELSCKGPGRGPVLASDCSYLRAAREALAIT